MNLLSEFVEDFKKQAEAEKVMSDLSNTEVADLLLEYVWSEMDVTKPSAVLLSVAIERLKKETGL